MGLKPGPKRTAISTGKPDRRQRTIKTLQAIRLLLNHLNAVNRITKIN